MTTAVMRRLPCRLRLFFWSIGLFCASMATANAKVLPRRAAMH